MTPDQSLNDLTGRVITALEQVLERVRPDWLRVRGDTTTAGDHFESLEVTTTPNKNPGAIAIS